ncbi:flavoprotein [Halioglobus japonicus]|uniref:FAD-binding protein n=1 Tax=Halioglobus japonicus TaxID=930805 RepID=A0AAP8MCS0_9GAMM|nr:FAD-dependent oxidoreductase [Halioglobus japonicus]AQA17447.1 flavoprotein [Halioglobus japonicus]PLW85371.1 FAD-binding protein [Halioglobus japonicus]GHD22073.1 putative fumarate reductase/succinate dehydrogenase [Halioglobus japonicus]
MSDTKKATPTQPRHVRDVSNWDKETDVAIVGFGGAGGCAAIEAADAGADVTIFELASASGGSTAMSSAEIYMGGSGGTRVQKACGFDDSTEDMVTYMMMSAGPQADEAKIRNYCESSSAHFDWLTGLGVPFKDSFHEERAIMCLTDDCLLYTGSEKAYPFRHHAKPCPRGHNLEIEGDNGGPLFMKIVTENVEKRDSITVEYETRALCLIADDEGAVAGLVIRQGKKELNVRARKGVILCAGGFNMNEEMLQKYAPKLLRGNEPIGNPGDTGTGIMMGMSVGGAAINMHEGFISIPYYPPASITGGIVVNDKGQRFINEDVYHSRLGQAVLDQPGDRFYFILTVEQYGDYEKFNFMGASIAGTGETIAELEEELGLRKGTLENTINIYNEDVAAGEDTQFHKGAEWLQTLELPLVALDITPGRGAFVPYFTLGGLDTLPTGEVVDPQRNVVPGLYAAGRTACGVVRRADGYSSGMSVGDATFSGRLAGKQAAARS